MTTFKFGGSGRHAFQSDVLSGKLNNVKERSIRSINPINLARN